MEPSLAERIQLAAFELPHQVVNLRALASIRNGTPLVPILAGLGLWEGLRRRKAAAYHAILLACVLAEFAALLTIDQFFERYAYPFVPIVLIWAAGGTVFVARSVRRWVGDARASRLSAAVVPGAIIVLCAWCGASAVALRREATNPTLFRDAGAWIEETGGRGSTVMGVDDLTAYYARGIWRDMPYTESGDRALAYIRTRRPAFVVLDSEFPDRPYIAAWLAHRVPLHGLTLVFCKQYHGKEIEVYRVRPE